MKKTILAITTIATIGLVGCGSGGGDGGEDSVETHPYNAPAISQADMNEYLGAVNAARASGRTCGEWGYFPAAPALQWSNELYSSSYEHTEDMVTAGIQSHQGSGGASDWTAQILELGRGSTPSERMRNNGMISSGTVENIGGGYGSASAMVAGWLRSPGHCAAIMGGGSSHMGMARIGSTWTYNVT